MFRVAYAAFPPGFHRRKPPKPVPVAQCISLCRGLKLVCRGRRTRQ
jgi:hypothetical protein